MKVEIPINLVQEAIDAGIIQTHGSAWSADLRGEEVRRKEYHFSEIVIGLILKEYNTRKLLPNNQK